MEPALFLASQNKDSKIKPSILPTTKIYMSAQKNMINKATFQNPFQAKEIFNEMIDLFK